MHLNQGKGSAAAEGAHHHHHNHARYSTHNPPPKKNATGEGGGDNTPTVHADDDEEYEWGGRFSLAWDRVLPLRAACFPAALAERAFFLGRWVGGWVGSGVLMDMYFLDVCGCGGFLGGVGG